MRGARASTTSQRARAAMHDARDNMTQAIVDISRNTCAARISDIFIFDDRDTKCIDAPPRCRQKARSADSESQFLAIKIFSSLPASRLIAARQDRLFARIAALIRFPHFCSTAARRGS
jgi:hypothetical protein